MITGDRSHILSPNHIIMKGVTMANRVSKHWTYNKANDVDHFDLETLTKDNLVNNILAITYDDITMSTIMELFADFGGKSFCHQYDTFEVPVGAYRYKDAKGKEVSNQNKFITTFGIWIFNVEFIRDLNFGFIFGYMNENINSKIFGKMQDKLSLALIEKKIDIETYKKFLDTSDFFMIFETVLSPNHTEALLSCTKKINKKKAELAKKYKEQLDAGDIVVAERMEQELLDYAKEFLGDDPGLDPLLSGAGGSYGDDFKNLFCMRGAVKDPDPNSKQPFSIALSSFVDGISAEEYSTVSNTLAKGAYSRAKKTETGGYWENLVSDACSYITIDPPGSDCGTKGYGKVTITEDNYMDYMYNFIIKSNGELEELTSDNIDKYIGKEVKMRLATYCKSKTGYCHHCAGNFFYRRESNKAGLALSLIPNRLKLVSLKAFHSSNVKTHPIDLHDAFFSQ